VYLFCTGRGGIAVVFAAVRVPRHDLVMQEDEVALVRGVAQHMREVLREGVGGRDWRSRWFWLWKEGAGGITGRREW